MEKRLSEFRVGEKGRIKIITCDNEIKRRMADMGLVPGVELELKRIAPLGDPIEISLRGYNLAIRKYESSLITMEV